MIKIHAFTSYDTVAAFTSNCYMRHEMSNHGSYIVILQPKKDSEDKIVGIFPTNIYYAVSDDAIATT